MNIAFLASGLIICAALGLLGFGIASLIDPVSVFAWLGVQLPNDPLLLLELRAFFGGLEIGLAFALLWTLRQPERLKLGLGLIAVSYGSIGIGRCLALFSGGTTHIAIIALILELGFAAAALSLLTRQPGTHVVGPAKHNAVV